MIPDDPEIEPAGLSADKDAEIARLKEFIKNNEYKLADERDAVIEGLQSALAEARKLLQELHDIQNGAPLITYEKEWNDIMRRTESFLKGVNDGQN